MGVTSLPSGNGKDPSARSPPPPPLLEALVELLAVLIADDPLGSEHRGVGTRLLHVVGPEAPVETDRVVDRPEDWIRGLGKAGHGQRIVRAPCRAGGSTYRG